MDSSNSLFQSSFAELSLQRIPRAKQQSNPLRAWDAADELLLKHLAEQQLPSNGQKLLIINDSFGALSCSLADYRADYCISHWSDSLISQLACKENLDGNHLEDRIDWVDSISSPSGLFDLVLIKVPKSLALLEHQLITLQPHVTEKTLVIAGGMVKYLQKSYQQLFEQYLGNTTTSLAVKKARLIFAGTEKTTQVAQSPYPQQNHYQEIDLHISQHANVFSRDKLDIGTRFMLQQYQQLPSANSIVDLGCGNGILGIMAKRLQPEARVYFIDESYMAVASAQDNYFNALNLDSQQEQDRQQFMVSHCLEQTPLTAIDLILCNPPFHQSNTVGDQIAWQMFQQSFKALNKQGRLWVIGNRHLDYHNKLKRLFANCKTVASNKKFVILEAVKR
ncbi:methyltransferase [Oceanicoccus sagamiensis]|uniref:Ribosomal RNA large subunit methyltransferase G n=1 Tax=Oceanicoccus sagamiensis TaxID=716816 RepID=A0A1X9NFB2_9GAMM|nr:methyltransferase [Oceanicoccus sagamiensis]ARN75861.1 hypothetical protein BST96_18185 [Oceanicoccus sagamiensis]